MKAQPIGTLLGGFDPSSVLTAGERPGLEALAIALVGVVPGSDDNEGDVFSFEKQQEKTPRKKKKHDSG